MRSRSVVTHGVALTSCTFMAIAVACVGLAPSPHAARVPLTCAWGVVSQVLSVVAQQVLEIQLAVKAKLKTFTFEGSELTLRPSCNVFM